MIRALASSAASRSDPDPPAVEHDLDESQKAAVAWDQGPLLVDAGPGTGKTRTLVHRIKHLLDKGSLSSSFLALTFSNKAAEEMRERLSAMNADAAIEMWVGTFHAFGLELVTKWPSASADQLRSASSIKPVRSPCSKQTSTSYRYATFKISMNRPTSLFMSCARFRAARTSLSRRLTTAPPPMQRRRRP